MTTLTNPTDAELNEAFAEHVCKWTRAGMMDEHVMWFFDGAHDCGTPSWTQSMDAVLPWLDRCREIGLWVTICDHTNGINHGERDWLVSISNRDEREWNFDGNGWMFWEVANPSLPRACVLALLKAHGVGVVYGASSKTELQ
jgi:hypothetical protein